MMMPQTTKHSTAQADKMCHDREVNASPRQPSHLLLRVAAGHLLLELFLQLLAGADGLLVAGEVRQLLQPGVGEVLRKMIAAPFVGRKKLLLAKGDIQCTEFRNQEEFGFCFVFLQWSQCCSHHQPVVHAHFAQAGSNGVDVLLVDPRLEQLDGEGCRHS